MNCIQVQKKMRQDSASGHGSRRRRATKKVYDCQQILRSPQAGLCPAVALTGAMTEIWRAWAKLAEPSRRTRIYLRYRCRRDSGAPGPRILALAPSRPGQDHPSRLLAVESLMVAFTIRWVAFCAAACPSDSPGPLERTAVIRTGLPDGTEPGLALMLKSLMASSAELAAFAAAFAGALLPEAPVPPGRLSQTGRPPAGLLWAEYLRLIAYGPAL